MPVTWLPAGGRVLLMVPATRHYIGVRLGQYMLYVQSPTVDDNRRPDTDDQHSYSLEEGSSACRPGNRGCPDDIGNPSVRNPALAPRAWVSTPLSIDACSESEFKHRAAP